MLRPMELHFERYGDGDPLILLHGLLGSLDNWRSTSARLGQSFKVFALDQRNHGRSPHSFEMNYDLMAKDVHQFLNHQGLQDAFILGHSMGGKTAMQLALRYPSAVRKLIAVDISPRSYSPRHEKVIKGMLALDLRCFRTRQEIEVALAPAVPDLTIRQFLLMNLERNQAGELVWKIGLEEISRNYTFLREAISSSPPFEKNTLFIRGERSDYLLESDLELIHSLFPQAVLRNVPRAAHLVHTENPSAFEELVVDFLRAA
jgi:pimeloyl-ACP methyl ester carboxylesterase